MIKAYAAFGGVTEIRHCSDRKTDKTYHHKCHKQLWRDPPVWFERRLACTKLAPEFNRYNKRQLRIARDPTL